MSNQFFNMVKYVRLKIWLLRYTVELKRRTRWSFHESWLCGEATLENYNYDLEDLDCPIYMVGEDLSCWRD